MPTIDLKTVKPFVPTKLPDQFAQEPTSPFHTEHVKWKESDESDSSTYDQKAKASMWVPKSQDSLVDSEPMARRRTRGKRKQR